MIKTCCNLTRAICFANISNIHLNYPITFSIQYNSLKLFPTKSIFKNKLHLNTFKSCLPFNQKSFFINLSRVMSFSSSSENKIADSASSNNNITADHKFTNRLVNEQSPYLLQHAHNPVDWFPW